jgi:hypothetical protein
MTVAVKLAASRRASCCLAVRYRMRQTRIEEGASRDSEPNAVMKMKKESMGISTGEDEGERSPVALPSAAGNVKSKSGRHISSEMQEYIYITIC